MSVRAVLGWECEQQTFLPLSQQTCSTSIPRNAAWHYDRSLGPLFFCVLAQLTGFLTSQQYPRAWQAIGEAPLHVTGTAKANVDRSASARSKIKDFCEHELIDHGYPTTQIAKDRSRNAHRRHAIFGRFLSWERAR